VSDNLHGVTNGLKNPTDKSPKQNPLDFLIRWAISIRWLAEIICSNFQNFNLKVFV